jgi:hypothetical protein
MPPAPDATIQALRRDMALQIIRFIRARGAIGWTYSAGSAGLTHEHFRAPLR